MNMWPGWIAKFLTSNAATLAPARAREILAEFKREHGHAFEPAQERGFGAQEKPNGEETESEPIR